MSDEISAHDAWNAISHLKALTSSKRRHVGPTALVATNLLSIALTLAEGAAAAEARGYARGRADAIAALRQADTSGWPGGRNWEVQGCREAAIAVVESIADSPSTERSDG